MTLLRYFKWKKVLLWHFKLKVVNPAIVKEWMMPLICTQSQRLPSIVIIVIALLEVNQKVRQCFPQWHSNLMRFLLKVVIQLPEVLNFLAISHGIVITTAECSFLDELFRFDHTLKKSKSIRIIPVFSSLWNPAYLMFSWHNCLTTELLFVASIRVE